MRHARPSDKGRCDICGAPLGGRGATTNECAKHASIRNARLRAKRAGAKTGVQAFPTHVLLAEIKRRMGGQNGGGE
jgi:hypothetical protein